MCLQRCMLAYTDEGLAGACVSRRVALQTALRGGRAERNNEARDGHLCLRITHIFQEFQNEALSACRNGGSPPLGVDVPSVLGKEGPS